MCRTVFVPVVDIEKVPRAKQEIAMLSYTASLRYCWIHSHPTVVLPILGTTMKETQWQLPHQELKRN